MSYRNVGRASKKKLTNRQEVGSLSPKNVWGKVVLYLKEHKKISLFVACGDITDVQIENNQLFIKTSDDFLVSVLEEGKKELENALRWQGLNMEVKIVKFENDEQLRDKDIIKLKRFFGDKLVQD